MDGDACTCALTRFALTPCGHTAISRSSRHQRRRCSRRLRRRWQVASAAVPTIGGTCLQGPTHLFRRSGVTASTASSRCGRIEEYFTSLSLQRSDGITNQPLDALAAFMS